MKIAVSSCLLGNNCNYSACHNKDDFVVDELSSYVEYLPFCPEVVMLGTPRETIRIVKVGNKECVIGNNSGKDYTNELTSISIEQVEEIVKEEICGFIFKSKSPSCGIDRVKVYTQKNGIDRVRAGVMATYVMEKYPLLPIEDNSRLLDPWLRENFVMQIFAYRDFEILKKANPKQKDLVEFHTSYKFLCMSKSTKSYQELGRIVSNMQKLPFEEVLKQYEIAFKGMLQLKNSRRKSFNTLQHLYGFMKHLVDNEEKNEILSQFDDFKKGLIPIISPLNLILMLAKKYKIAYLLTQKYLNPYPKELKLRSDLSAYK